jgi:hypothetical protein
MAALTDGPALPDALEQELAGLRADPAGAVGYGEKTFVPYEPVGAHFLMGFDDPAVTRRLLAEMEGEERTLRLALLQVIGRRTDAEVDPALLAALGDPELRATAAYLLGRPGFKGYPGRSRDAAALAAALRPYADDPTPFDDPFLRRTFRTGDFVLAALVRLLGPERFTLPPGVEADLVGYTVPAFDDAARAALLAQLP